MSSSDLSPEALIIDASRYFSGDGVKASISDGIKCLKLAAQQGSSEANYRLGVIYSNGRIQPFNADQALYYFLAAAEEGHEGAEFGVAQISLQTGDYETARTLFSQLSEKGNATATLNAAQLFLLGRGGPVDVERCIELLSSIADQSKIASYQLALMYYRGDETAQSYEKSIAFCEQAIALGEPEALALLAGILTLDTEHLDKPRALALYQEAREAGIKNLESTIETLSTDT